MENIYQHNNLSPEITLYVLDCNIYHCLFYTGIVLLLNTNPTTT